MFHTGLREIMVPIRRMSNQQCNKGCPQCQKMHGKGFEVAQAEFNTHQRFGNIIVVSLQL